MSMSSSDNWRKRECIKKTRFKRIKKHSYIAPKEEVKPKLTQEEIDNTFSFRSTKVVTSSPISEDERHFFREWAHLRHIDDQYVVLALSYWTRVKSSLGPFFIIRKKELYMITCLHISLKWLGYDEEYKCNFIADFRQVSNITKDEHKELEMHILKELDWTL